MDAVISLSENLNNLLYSLPTEWEFSDCVLAIHAGKLSVMISTCFGRYLHSTYPNKNNKEIKQKVSRDITEQWCGIDTHRKIVINDINAPNLSCFC